MLPHNHSLQEITLIVSYTKESATFKDKTFIVFYSAFTV